MTIKAIIFDLGNTLIEQNIDFINTLDEMELKLLPGVKELLRAISKKYHLGILTNTKKSTSQHVRAALQNLSIADYFEAIVTSFDVGVEKPDPKMFHTLLLKLRANPGESLMVGNDPLQDIEGARKVGMRTAFIHKNKAYKNIDTDYHFSSFKDLAKILRHLEKDIG